MSCPPRYSLDGLEHSNWTTTQEKTVSRDYPFADLQAEPPDQFVVRTYLQFLWLPDSIMPLKLLVPSLLRVNVASSSQPSPHPLHALVDPLLLTPRSVANKYHVELPQILSDGGGAGEIEECVMWFALNHEKSDEVPDQKQLSGEGPWADETWRKIWLERLEIREVKIQILLYLLLMSLPQPPQDRLESIMAGRLESFMDKLSMWQLVEGLDADSKNNHSDRDQMQVFCEDLVELLFQSILPEACALLRTKVFPNSPFSDDDGSLGPSRPPSPDAGRQETGRTGSLLASSAQRHPALPSSASVLRGSRETKKPMKPESSHPAIPMAQRSRSRSLSVTLALDADARRAASVGTGVATKKRPLHREVSMSRVFKGKSQEKEKDQRMGEITRVSGQEVSAHSMEEKRAKRSRVDSGKTLVAATPVKYKARSQGSNITGREEEEAWDIPGSPLAVTKPMLIGE